MFLSTITITVENRLSSLGWKEQSADVARLRHSGMCHSAHASLLTASQSVLVLRYRNHASPCSMHSQAGGPKPALARGTASRRNCLSIVRREPLLFNLTIHVDLYALSLSRAADGFESSSTTHTNYAGGASHPVSDFRTSQIDTAAVHQIKSSSNRLHPFHAY